MLKIPTQFKIWTPVGLRFALAAARAKGADRALLSMILRTHLSNRHRSPDVYVATPRRFLKLHRLSSPSETTSAMLQFIRTVQETCEERGLSTRLVINERLPPDVSGKLIFSHHTYRDDFFAHLEKAGNAVWHFKVADLPTRMTLDRTGFAGWSSLAEMPINQLPMVASKGEIDEFFQRSHKEIASSNISKYAQPARSSAAIRDGRPYVFVALQIINDIVQRHAYVPMLEMLQMVTDRFLRTEYDVVIKRHPRCKSEEVAGALSKLVASSNRITITQRSIHDLLEGAAALFTVNSGVGSEAIAYGIPIYCFGKSDYAPVAHQIKSSRDLETLTSPIRRRCTLEDHKRFHYFYRNIYQVSIGGNLRSRVAQIIEAHRVRQTSPPPGIESLG